jgi:hypothetical protein
LKGTSQKFAILVRREDTSVTGKIADGAFKTKYFLKNYLK